MVQNTFYLPITFIMPTVQTTYLGELRTEATHLQSGTKILTDAPTDNQGKGEAFSPTDLVATALGSCIITTMGIVANRDGVDLRGSNMEITKVMSSEAPRRIAQIVIKISMVTDSEWNDDMKAKYVRIAHTCPVAISLHPDVLQTVTFEWSVAEVA
jgi:putative redox protein